MELCSRLPALLRSSNCVLMELLLGELNGTKSLRFSDCVIHLQPWQGRLYAPNEHQM